MSPLVRGVINGLLIEVALGLAFVLGCYAVLGFWS